MKRLYNRFRWVILLLVFFGAVAGGYDYFNNYRMDGEKIVARALRNGTRLNSYYSSIEMSPAGNEAQRYFVQTWFLAPARYRVEVFTTYIGEGPPAQVFISDGERRWIYSPEVKDYYQLNPLSNGNLSASPFLLTSFLEQLAKAREVELLGIEKHDKRTYYLLKVFPEAVSRGYAWEKVWLEKRSLLPVKIQVYDEQDHLYQTITFKKIDLNPNLNEDTFRVETAFYMKTLCNNSALLKIAQRGSGLPVSTVQARSKGL